ncbi:bifunctional DNA primase/polymerase [Nocardiopsis flavescens]|uniref:bifunctional DNA primase/polymerase n=1 Tax=Nocardiopsis flavescens TaxID=758803 RepID=UPI003664701F
MSALPSALAAARRGWHVFPLTPGEKGPPLVRRWEQAATTAPDRIHAWWNRTPNANYGIATGPSGLVVVDLDTPKDGQTPPQGWALPGVVDGADVLAVVAERAGQPLPLDTFTVRTRRGGLHLYFTHPEGERLTNTSGDKGSGLGWLIDTRAHGGYVVGPGSRVGASAYAPLNRDPAAPLPAWLATLLKPAPLPPQRPVRVPVATDRRTAYLRSAVTAELSRITDAPPRERNNALYLASVALGQLVAGGELTEAQVTAWLSEAAARVGQTPREIPKTIASGLRAGAHRPRKVAA